MPGQLHATSQIHTIWPPYMMLQCACHRSRLYDKWSQLLRLSGLGVHLCMKWQLSKSDQPSKTLISIQCQHTLSVSELQITKLDLLPRPRAIITEPIDIIDCAAHPGHHRPRASIQLGAVEGGERGPHHCP